MRRKLIWLTLFAVAMAYLSAVVIYLRTIYYPEGFAFPLKPIPTSIILLHFQNRGVRFTPTKGEWAAGIMAGLFIFVSFITESKKVLAYDSPETYHWWTLVAGEISEIMGFIRLLHRTVSTQDNS